MPIPNTELPTPTPTPGRVPTLDEDGNIIPQVVPECPICGLDILPGYMCPITNCPTKGRS